MGKVKTVRAGKECCGRAARGARIRNKRRICTSGQGDGEMLTRTSYKQPLITLAL